MNNAFFEKNHEKKSENIKELVTIEPRRNYLV